MPEDICEILKEIEFFENIKMEDQAEYNLYWKCVKVFLEVYETQDLFKNEVLNQEADQMLEDQSPIELLKFQEEIETSLRSSDPYWMSLVSKIKHKFATSVMDTIQ